MGSVPESKSGVASAMNDVTRQVAGALGTAVVGSLVTSLYTHDVGEIPVGSSDASSIAFTDAVGIGFAAAATAALVGAAIVRRWLPSERGARAAEVELPSDVAVEGRAA